MLSFSRLSRLDSRARLLEDFVKQTRFFRGTRAMSFVSMSRMLPMSGITAYSRQRSSSNGKLRCSLVAGENR